jgi:hypothetical protein
MAHCISKSSSRRLSQLAALINRDGGACIWCGRSLSVSHPEATIEHILPLSKGGPNVFENMLLACGPCNHRRQSVPALTWLHTCEAEGLATSHAVIVAGFARASAIMVPA